MKVHHSIPYALLVCCCHLLSGSAPRVQGCRSYTDLGACLVFAVEATKASKLQALFKRRFAVR